MKSLKSYKVCFIGRTGNGKTSLINRLFGTKFSTDPLISCTKELYSVSFMLPEGKTYEAVTVYDSIPVSVRSEAEDGCECRKNPKKRFFGACKEDKNFRRECT